MAIRFSMSEDTSIISSTSKGKQKRRSLEQINIITQQGQQHLDKPTVSKTQTNCKCSNIRAMQLFYEMKQEFPNIPDDVVNYHVIDNIHNPENCKAKLKSEIDSCLVPVQSYPQQLLRVLNRDSVVKKQSNFKSSEPIENNYNNCSENHFKKSDTELSILNEAAGFSEENTFNRAKCKQFQTPDIKDMRSGVCSIQITTYSSDLPRNQDALEKANLKSSPKTQVSQRPTTLNLKKDTLHHIDNRQEFSIKQPTKQDIGDSVFSSASPHTQTTYTPLGNSEILVNVSLSPSSRRSQDSGNQRYQSTINVRPQLPFTRNIELATGNNHKSYTSVNLVLRQPSSNPQSPIDITVGPNLTYSTSSYHPQLGYQNNYKITVTDECGVFSAFRISPLNFNSSRLDTLNKDDCDETPGELNVNAENFLCSQNSIVKAPNSNGQIDASKIIMRQHKQKDRILAVLRKNKNKLNLVHKEVEFAMRTEVTDSISEMLDKEIVKLRCDCQTMLNEIENSRNLGLREDSIQQTSTIKSRQANSFPKYKAICYPAPVSNNNCSQIQTQSFRNESVSSQRNPSIAYRDENSHFGAGD